MRPLSPLALFGIRLATLVLAVYWIALFTGTHMPSPPKTGLPQGDKAQHFIAFFGLATLLCWALPTRGRPLRKAAIVLSLAIVYAAFDEWSQRFAPNRTVDIDDFYTNAAGILTATACWAATRAVYLRCWPYRPTVTTAGHSDATPPMPRSTVPRRSPPV